MASAMSSCNESDVNKKKWTLKKIRNVWFLDNGVLLKKMDVLSNKKDIHLEDNLIFADDVIYQLFEESNGNISLFKVDVVEEKDKPISLESEIQKYPDESDTEFFNRLFDKHFSLEPLAFGETKEESGFAELRYTSSLLYSREDINSENSHEEVLTWEVPGRIFSGNSSAHLLTEAEKYCEESFRRKGVPQRIYQRIKNVLRRKSSTSQINNPLNDQVSGCVIDSSASNINKMCEDKCSSESADSSTDTGETYEVHALFDFDGNFYDKSFSFRKGNKLEVKIKFSEEWCFALHLKTGKTGWIPSAYVTKIDWWYNLDRQDAERFLLQPFNPAGTFLLRNSEDKLSFMLSLKCFNPTKNRAFVRNYRIRRSGSGGFYIKQKDDFVSLVDLINHYIKNPSLRCQLLESQGQLKELDVSKESVTLTKKLKDGYFGDTYSGKLHKAVDVAVKITRQGEMTADDYLVVAKLLHRLRHKRIVQLLAVCTKPEPIWIITELMSNGALLDFLRNDKGKGITFDDIVCMAYQIADGMAYLEIEHVIHNDLKAANIYVGDRNIVKIGHFHHSRMIEEDVYEMPRDSPLNVKWTALEAIYDAEFSIKSDVWSYGVVLYELITFGREPYPDLTDREVTQKLKEGFRMPKPTEGPVPCPDPFYEMMLDCWYIMPDGRPTFEFLQDFFCNYAVNVCDRL